MALTSDYILQQLLDESKRENNHLTDIKDLLIKQQSQNNKSSNNSNSNSSDNQSTRRRSPPPPSGKGVISNLFKTTMGEAGNFTKFMAGNNVSMSNTVNSLSTGITSVSSALEMIPGPVGLAATAFTTIVRAGTALYNYMNEQLDMYNQLSSAGLQLSQGMISARKSAGQAMMSQNDFNKALSSNSSAIASMSAQYGDGVQYFGNLLSTIQQAQNSIGIYGVSQQQLANAAVKNFQFDKLYGTQRQLQAMTQAQSTEQFVQNMTTLSKTVGMSIDKMMATFDDMSKNSNSTLSFTSLMEQFGFTQQKASTMVKGLNETFSSMGEAGKTLQNISTQRLEIGNLPSELSDQFSTQLSDMMLRMQQAGVTSSTQQQQMIKSYLTSHRRDLLQQMEVDRRTGNEAALQFHNALYNYIQLATDPKNNPTPIFESAINRFNTWIGKSVTQPFNNFMNSMEESIGKYFINVADRSNGTLQSFIETMYSDLVNSIKSVFNRIIELPKNLLGSIFGDNAVNQIYSSFENLVSQLINIPFKIFDTLRDAVTGNSQDLQNDVTALFGSIKGMFSSVKGVFTGLSNMTFNYDDLKKTIQNTFQSFKEKLSSFWTNSKNWLSNASDKMVQWWNDTDSNGNPIKKSPTNVNNNEPRSSTINHNTTVVAVQPRSTGSQKVTAQPESTNQSSEKINDNSSQNDNNQTPVIDNNQTQSQQQSSTDDVIDALNQILNSMDKQGSTFTQLSTLLRQIADNTVPQRNL